eukprot:TRINITY_DN2186_c0_g2_i1.p1 TRINITY_DN2186_c0_g2~~TRINITY_DN2186_c0_g2_i1.p1  ORF type:complete len:288 (+),score=83.19 TRINITY_DN2186_c0_g2_i1:33-896(+)
MPPRRRNTNSYIKACSANSFNTDKRSRILVDSRSTSFKTPKVTQSFDPSVLKKKSNSFEKSSNIINPISFKNKVEDDELLVESNVPTFSEALALSKSQAKKKILTKDESPDTFEDENILFEQNFERKDNNGLTVIRSAEFEVIEPQEEEEEEDSTVKPCQPKIIVPKKKFASKEMFLQRNKMKIDDASESITHEINESETSDCTKCDPNTNTVLTSNTSNSLVESNFAPANYQISDDFEDLIPSFHFSSEEPFPDTNGVPDSDFGLSFDDDIYLNPFYSDEQQEKKY